MFKTLPREELINEIKKYKINYEIRVTDYDNKVTKVYKDDINNVDLNTIKAVEFFIKKPYGLHLMYFRVI